MKTVAVVPIKTNNERLPGKNTRNLGGKPLIQYILDTLVTVRGIDEIYVYCSDASIERFLPKGIRLLKRSKSLDRNDTNFTQIFSAFMREIRADIYIYTHATAPFIKSETIEKALVAVHTGKYDSAFSAEKIQDFLWMNGTAVNFDASDIPRSQDLPIIWRETSGVYVFRNNVFEDFHRRVGNKPFFVEVSKKETVDINTYADFRLAEQLVNWEE